MGKLSVRRFDIFLADLSQFNIEPHYVVCVSNWKNNIKSSAYNFLMISSKIKKHPSHVDIEGFGLKEKSQIKCEKIYTLELDNLIMKIGHINDINIEVEIEEKLAQQLQLDSKYNNFDALDLEELFINNNSKIENDKVKLEKLEDEMHENFSNKRYKEAIIVAYKLKEYAQNSKINNKDQFIWCSLYIKSLCNLKLKNVQEAIVDAQQSLVYIKLQENSINYSLNLWLLSRCYEEIGDFNKSRKIYSILIKYYKNNNETMLRISCCFNLCKLNNSKKSMLKVYDILKNYKYTNRNIYESENYKYELLSMMKNELDTLKSI